MIELIDILDFPARGVCKIYLSSRKGKENALEVFLRDRSECASWISFGRMKAELNYKFILSFIEFHPEPNAWLFGGIYRVCLRPSNQHELELCQDYRHYIGRLKVHFKRPGGAKMLDADKFFEDITVLEVLRQPYEGEAFCGYENIDHSFAVLEQIFQSSKPDWKAALENIKGIYLITDLKNGKHYVGSAYGRTGIWSRWRCYIDTGHGGNDVLTKLIKVSGIEYARKHFKLKLLESYQMKVEDQLIIDRETHWKKVLLTRTYGYNKN